MKNKNLIITILVVVIVAGASFFGGMKYQQSRRPALSRQFPGQQTQRQGVNFRPINGEIIKADDKSLTVKLTDNSSKIVLLSDKTSLNKASTAAKDDLKVGETVAVFGTENTDGTVTAQSIQLNPVLRGQSNQ